MTLRKNTRLHDKWHRRVEGQIRCCMREHPEWFRGDTKRMVNSLAKRIVGEIVADCGLATMAGSSACEVDDLSAGSVTPNCTTEGRNVVSAASAPDAETTSGGGA